MKHADKILLRLNEMSLDDARKLLELSKHNDDIDKAYRVAALKYHPDRGGSTEKMQDVNQAYELLSKSGVKGSKAYKDREQHRKDFEEVKREYAEKKKREAERVNSKLDTFLSQFNSRVPEWNRHFLQYFNLKEPKIIVRKAGSRNLFHISADVSVVWPTEDNKTEVRLTIAIFERSDDKSSLGAQDVDFMVSYTTSLYHNRKEYRMAKSSYKINVPNTSLLDPETSFPTKKLKKIFNATNTIVSKKDAYKFFEVELDAIFMRDDVLVPIDGKASNATNFIHFYRTTMFGRGHAAWTMVGVKERQGKSFRQVKHSFGSFPESKNGLEAIEDFIKRLRKGESVPEKHADFLKMYPNMSYE